MSQIIKVQVLYDRIMTMKDNGLKLTLLTQELKAEEEVLLLRMKNKFGWAWFSPNEFQDVELPQEQAQEFKNDRTPSQRLRAVLYRYWERQKSSMGFDDFYKMTMNGIIDEYKEKLDGFF